MLVSDHDLARRPNHIPNLDWAKGASFEALSAMRTRFRCCSVVRICHQLTTPCADPREKLAATALTTYGLDMERSERRAFRRFEGESALLCRPLLLREVESNAMLLK